MGRIDLFSYGPEVLRVRGMTARSRFPGDSLSRGVTRGWWRALAVPALVAGLTLGVAQKADASIVERIVAVVGERPILLSELRQRARPHLSRIAQSTQNPTQQAAAESEMFRVLLNRMIDDRLEEQAADKAHLTVTPEEVDNAIRQVAGQAKLDPRELINEAKRQGLSEQDYRDEMRRQVLEGKLIQLRVRGRVRVTEQDARATYKRLVKENATQSPVDLHVLVLQIPPGSTQELTNARMVLGEELSRRGNSGEDFCQLIREFSQDPRTKNTCGSSGPLPLNALLPELQQVATTQKPGQVSAPILFRDPTGQQAILVVQTTEGGPMKIPPYEDVKEQMMEQAFAEATKRQRDAWVQELRRGVYIDVRL
jgi:peptidyl-prolyl cis-trans isomerase SurA